MKSIRPPNSIIFVHGNGELRFPQAIWGAQILATRSVISIVCMPEIDGTTAMILGDAAETGRLGDLHYEGELPTQGRVVKITDVLGHTIAELPASERSLVKVWRSHPRWPEQVTISIEPAGSAVPVAARLAPLSTTAVLPAFEPVSWLALIDGSVPRAQRDFNPWLHPNILQSAILLEIGGPLNLTVEASDRPCLARNADDESSIATPSGEVQIFGDPPGQALLKANVATAMTRVQTFIDRSSDPIRARVILSPI